MVAIGSSLLNCAAFLNMIDREWKPGFDACPLWKHKVIQLVLSLACTLFCSDENLKGHMALKITLFKKTSAF